MKFYVSKKVARTLGCISGLILLVVVFGCSANQEYQTSVAPQQVVNSQNSTEDSELNTLLYTGEKARSITGGSVNADDAESENPALTHQPSEDQPNNNIGSALSENEGSESNELPIDYSF